MDDVNSHKTAAFGSAVCTGLALCVLTVLAPPAHAALVLSISPSQAYVGSSGEFDVLLTDTDSAGSTPYDINSFGFELTTDPTQTTAGGDSDLTFDGVSADATGVDGASYIFSGNGGFPYSTGALNSPTDIEGDDNVDNDPFYVTVNPGDVYSLGDVSYSIASGVPVGTALSVDFTNTYEQGSNQSGTTYLINQVGVELPITAVNGSVSATPEPSQAGMLALIGLGLGGLLLRARRRHAS